MGRHDDIPYRLNRQFNLAYSLVESSKKFLALILIVRAGSEVCDLCGQGIDAGGYIRSRHSEKCRVQLLANRMIYDSRLVLCTQEHFLADPVPWLRNMQVSRLRYVEESKCSFVHTLHARFLDSRTRDTEKDASTYTSRIRGHVELRFVHTGWR